MATTPSIDARELQLTMDNTERLHCVAVKLRRRHAIHMLTGSYSIQVATREWYRLMDDVAAEAEHNNWPTQRDRDAVMIAAMAECDRIAIYIREGYLGDLTAYMTDKQRRKYEALEHDSRK